MKQCFIVCFFSFFLFSVLAKDKPTLAEIYKAKAQSERAVKESIEIEKKYGEKSSEAKKANVKAKKALKTFNELATIEYWKAVMEKSEVEVQAAKSSLELCDRDDR